MSEPMTYEEFFRHWAEEYHAKADAAEARSRAFETAGDLYAAACEQAIADGHRAFAWGEDAAAEAERATRPAGVLQLAGNVPAMDSDTRWEITLRAEAELNRDREARFSLYGGLTAIREAAANRGAETWKAAAT
jgi:hypothetical protein